jgi:hypothetical protein
MRLHTLTAALTESADIYRFFVMSFTLKQGASWTNLAVPEMEVS